MIELPTPETDSLFCRNGYPVEVDSSKAMQLCEKLEQERDWITEKFKLLEGCFKRAERERDEARELVKVYQEYTKLLVDEISDTAAVAYVHGWRTHRYEEGKVLREKIKQLEETK